jgi:O-antigen/teichoic acid export membrane protein
VYLEACSHIAFVAMPAMTLVAVLPGEFVRFVMGSQWEAAIPTVRILAIVGIVEPVAATSGWLFFAQGRADLSFRWGLLLGPVYILAFAIGVAGGSATSVALAYLGASALIVPVLLKISGSLVGVQLSDHIRTWGPTALSALGGGAVAYCVKLALQGQPDVVVLSLAGLAGGLVYLALARSMNVPQVDLIRRFVRQKLHRGETP